jgi:hypothetical protein
LTISVAVVTFLYVAIATHTIILEAHMVTEKTRLVEARGGVGRFFYALTATQLALITVMSLGLWFIGAMSVRIGSPLGLFGPTASLIAFAAAIPIGWGSVLFIIKVAKLSANQIVPSISLGLAIATFFDGIGITWASWLYGTDLAQIALGAAWILWGIFAFTAAAFVEAYRRGASTREPK